MGGLKGRRGSPYGPSGRRAEKILISKPLAVTQTLEGEEGVLQGGVPPPTVYPISGRG